MQITWIQISSDFKTLENLDLFQPRRITLISVNNKNLCQQKWQFTKNKCIDIVIKIALVYMKEWAHIIPFSFLEQSPFQFVLIRRTDIRSRLRSTSVRGKRHSSHNWNWCKLKDILQKHFQLKKWSNETLNNLTVLVFSYIKYLLFWFLKIFEISLFFVCRFHYFQYILFKDWVYSYGSPLLVYICFVF